MGGLFSKPEMPAPQPVQQPVYVAPPPPPAPVVAPPAPAAPTLLTGSDRSGQGQAQGDEQARRRAALSQKANKQPNSLLGG